MSIKIEDFKKIEKELDVRLTDLDKIILSAYSKKHNGFVSTDINDYKGFISQLHEYVCSPKGLSRLFQ